MGVPVRVTFESMYPTDEAMAWVQEQAESLQTSHGLLESCHVVIERPRRGKGKGRKYRADVTVIPKMTVGQSHCKASAVSEHSKLKLALTHAFRRAGTRLYYECLANAGPQRPDSKDAA